MTFTSRRLTSGRNNREAKESLLLHSEPTVRSNRGLRSSHNPLHSYSGSTSEGSDSYEVAGMAAKSRFSSKNRTTRTIDTSSRLTSDNYVQPQHQTGGGYLSPPAKEEKGVLQFVPAFDDTHDTTPDTSWDAILEEGAAAFPSHSTSLETRRLASGAKTEVGGFSSSSSRFRKKAQSTVGHSSTPVSSSLTRRSNNPPAIASSSSASVSGRSKGSKVARLASLFTGRDSKPTPTTTKTTNKTSIKKSSPTYTTDTTLPSSPSRSSSSSGYVNWPNTLNKQGDTVQIESSYEESDEGQNPPNLDVVDAVEDELPFDYQTEEQRLEMQQWMGSPAFQDISGVTPDPPSPPGVKADESSHYFDDTAAAPENHRKGPHSIPMNDLFQNTPGWDVDSGGMPSPSRTVRSNTSSAYFDINDARPTSFSEQRQRKQAAAVVMRGVRQDAPGAQAPTEEKLAVNNSLSPPYRSFSPSASRGYSGILHKTEDVPNLLDGVDSDSMASSRASSAVPSSTASAASPYHNNNSNYPSNGGGGSRMSGSMPRVHEEEVVTRDSESDVFDEISKYSIGVDSEPFEGILSQSKSEASAKSIRDADAFEGRNQSVVEESKASLQEMRNTTSSVEQRFRGSDKQRRSGGATDNSSMKVVLLGGGLTTIQTTTTDFSNRITASDYDECLTNSDIDEYGSIKLPSFQEMAAAGRSVNDSASAAGIALSVNPAHTMSFVAFDDDNVPRYTTGSNCASNYGSGSGISGISDKNKSEISYSSSERNKSETSYKDDESAFFSDFYSGDEVEFDGDLSQYYVQPSSVKKLVRKYRRMCRDATAKCHDYEEMDLLEDEKKAFAIFEMRSRIMEKDIERGLERRGGTQVVDDLVTTPFYRRSLRIRDAVIVSKAWRDGASPMDVINTANLTQRAERSYFIKRPVPNGVHPSPNSSLNDSSLAFSKYRMQKYFWEHVEWVDDMDFIRYSCPSLGARNLRGSEMFTIGDCQSILLKLTNESCMELRMSLNIATARQIEAEELMKEEGDNGDGMMTEAEMTYLVSMEEVKTISRQLVVAEKSFALVRDRIRNLVAKYESLLVKIDNEDMATSSVVTADSSCYSAYSSRVSTDFDQEERAWYRRQQRAEISAELAAREALLAKQSEARPAQEDKRREVAALKLRLVELQSEASTTTTDRKRSAVLAKAMAARRPSFSEPQDQQQNTNAPNNPQSTVDVVKQRFRDRMAARLRVGSNPPAREEQPQPAREEQQQPTSKPNSYFGKQRSTPATKTAAPALDRQRLIRLAGEEMFQHLDFYERSLKAVEGQREGAR